MATVFRALDHTLERDVAIKVLHTHLSSERGFNERFVQEARTIASLNHPNIVQVYDFDVIDYEGESLSYMVMRYVANNTLDTVLKEYAARKQVVPIDQVRHTMLDLCAALEYAHERGMVHRDIKPSNVLIEANGHAVLTDFGIAKLAQRSGVTQEGTIVGTPAYMSPEQATGEKIDGRSDLYSLGAVMFELLTGRPPFEDDNTISVLIKHVQTAPPRISDMMEIRNVFYDVIAAKALSKDPASRFQTAAEFAADIRVKLTEERQITPVLQRVLSSDKPFVGQLEVQTTRTFDNPKRNENPTITILRTIDTAIIRPARQNPLTFVALGIAVVSLLFVARVSQSIPLGAAPLATQSVTVIVDSMTSTEIYGLSTFAVGERFNNEWEQNNEGMITRIISNGNYVIRNDAEDTASTSLFNPDHVYDDVQITMDATLNTSSAENSGYGIVFRYRDPDNYNVFGIDGVGRFSLWTRENGGWRELREVGEDWTDNEAILPIGQTNKITMIVYKDLLIGYVNSKQIVRLQESTFKEGSIGIYFATPRNDNARLDVDTYLIARSENPAFSMTDSIPSGVVRPTATTANPIQWGRPSTPTPAS